MRTNEELGKLCYGDLLRLVREQQPMYATCPHCHRYGITCWVGWYECFGCGRWFSLPHSPPSPAGCRDTLGNRPTLDDAARVVRGYPPRLHRMDWPPSD